MNEPSAQTYSNLSSNSPHARAQCPELIALHVKLQQCRIIDGAVFDEVRKGPGPDGLRTHCIGALEEPSLRRGYRQQGR